MNKEQRLPRGVGHRLKCDIEGLKKTMSRLQQAAIEGDDRFLHIERFLIFLLGLAAKTARYILVRNVPVTCTPGDLRRSLMQADIKGVAEGIVA